MRKKSLFTYKKQKVQHPRTGIAPFLFIQKFLLFQYHFAGLLATVSHGLYDDVDATLQLAYLNTIGRVDLGAQNIGRSCDVLNAGACACYGSLAKTGPISPAQGSQSASSAGRWLHGHSM